MSKLNHNEEALIAFKLLVKFIRDEFTKVQEEQDAIPWKDMPSYAGCQIAIDVYSKFYKESLRLVDKFNLDSISIRSLDSYSDD